MATVTVRGYTAADEDGVISAWNAALPGDPIDHATFRRKVLLDPNFDPAWLRLAVEEDVPVGFCLTLRRRTPLEKVGLQPDRAWITAFGVVPERRGRGVGERLLAEAREAAASEGRERLLIAPYAPNYFVPGVDEALYAEGLAFLLRRGFVVTSRPIAMDANLVRLDIAPYRERWLRLAAAGIDVRPLEPGEIPLLLGFLEAHMPGDWLLHGREGLRDAARGIAPFDRFVVAVRQGEVLGYCASEGEHFGPFGVRDDCQGQGIGIAVLSRCLAQMRARGLHNAWVLWTSDDNAERVYGRFGFRETRRFSVLSGALPSEPTAR